MERILNRPFQKERPMNRFFQTTRLLNRIYHKQWVIPGDNLSNNAYWFLVRQSETVTVYTNKTIYTVIFDEYQFLSSFIPYFTHQLEWYFHESCHTSQHSNGMYLPHIGYQNQLPQTASHCQGLPNQPNSFYVVQLNQPI